MNLGMYSQNERSRRWALGRALMDAEGVEALLLYENTYFTGGPSDAIVVFPRDGRPVALTDGPSSSPWAPTRPSRHAYGIAEVLWEHRLHRSAVGVLGLEPYPPIHRGPLLPHSLWSRGLGLLHTGRPHQCRRLPSTPSVRISAGFCPSTPAVGPGFAALALRAGGGPISRGGVVLVEISCTYGFLEVRGRMPLLPGEVPGTVAEALDRAKAGLRGRAARRTARQHRRPGRRRGRRAPGRSRRGAVPRGAQPAQLECRRPGAAERPRLRHRAGMTFALQTRYGQVAVGGTVLTTEDGTVELFTPFTRASCALTTPAGRTS
ncbi:hypothetical protein ACBJ59_24290 [Nonomuraea sp. MTCD27]|uniref:hypothetical protein n=1 Tax=Nonomuraea sp. MTCD27 TaxID=1676747 RepID=UPI0035C0A0CD